MQIFDKEYNFRGQYGQYCRTLNSREGVGLFKTNREAYVFSSIIGFLSNERSEDVVYNQEIQHATILPSELAKQRENLRLIYHLIMLLKEEPNFTLEDYKNRTFRDEADEEHPEKLENNMKLFNSYAEGGIEYLYEKFEHCQNTGEVVDELYQFVSDFAVKAGLKEREMDFINFDEI